MSAPKPTVFPGFRPARQRAAEAKLIADRVLAESAARADVVLPPEAEEWRRAAREIHRTMHERTSGARCDFCFLFEGQ